LLAAKVLARSHRDHAAYQHINDCGHCEEQQDEKQDSHDCYLGWTEAKARWEFAREETFDKQFTIHARFAQGDERWRSVALRKTAAVLVKDERVVEIAWLWKAQEHLQQPLHGCGRPKVHAAHDHRYTACSVVDDTGKVIGGRRVLSSEDCIPDLVSPCSKRAIVSFPPGGESSELNCPLRVQTPAMWLSRPPAGVVWKFAASARVCSSSITVRSRERLRNVCPRAEAGKDETGGPKLGERSFIFRCPKRLDDDGFLPI
jgi:hypothetical protein